VTAAPATRLLARVRRRLLTLPLVGAVARRLRGALLARSFGSSSSYWARRYERGGDSGRGSRDELAAFKADTLNAFVRERGVRSVIEWGCGDGSQLARAQYPRYLGLDVSRRALELCRARFASDPTKSFLLVAEHAGERADLGLSIDVIYHLVEDDVFEDHMRRLFDHADRWVIAYSSDHDERSSVPHVRHRGVTAWVRAERPGWTLEERLPNRFPETVDGGSFATFLVFARPPSGG